MSSYGPLHDLVYWLFPEPIWISVTPAYPAWTLIAVGAVGQLRDWFRHP